VHHNSLEESPTVSVHLWISDRPRYLVLSRRNALFVALVERPLLDALAADQARLAKDAQMFAGRWLAHAQLLCDQKAAHPVLLQIAVYLGREMLGGLLEPAQNT